MAADQQANAVDRQDSGVRTGPSTPASKGKSPGKKGGKSTPARSKYSLRSSMDGVRVLRSRTATPEPVVMSFSNTGKKKGRGKKKGGMEKKPSGEFDVIRKQCRYLLTRISYEQNLLEAYAAEGWKGQSAEKIRPEKELQRATLEIARCKVKLRDFFKKIDTLCDEGKLDDKLFDADGEIDNEDIFCAKCGSKDMFADNDIILCDGVCDRGFHQMCLEPPLLTDQIPPGDEGWLCPGCDCKVDCIESVNHTFGTKFSIEDKWEKFFPEAAAVVAGDKHVNNVVDLPSDESEDDDYNPDDQVVEPSSGNEESSSSDVSSDSSMSEDIGPEDSNTSNDDKPHNPVDLLSDDSKDDDFEPMRLSPVKDKSEGSASDESDFSSDTDDLDGFVEDNEFPDLVETCATSAPSCPGNIDNSYSKHSSCDHRPVVEDTSNMQSASSISRKRNRDHSPQGVNENGSKNWASSLSGSTLETPIKRARAANSSKGNAESNGDIAAKLPRAASRRRILKQHASQSGESEDTPDGMRNKQELGLAHESCNDVHEQDASKKRGISSGVKTISAEVIKILNDEFIRGIYPTKEKKESMSKELNLSVYQISRWFENARRKNRRSSVNLEKKCEGSPLADDTVSKKIEQVIDGDGTSSENQRAKTETTWDKPSVESQTTGTANAGATVVKKIEVDEPKVGLPVDNGTKITSSLPRGIRFKTKCMLRYPKRSGAPTNIGNRTYLFGSSHIGNGIFDHCGLVGQQ